MTSAQLHELLQLNKEHQLKISSNYIEIRTLEENIKANKKLIGKLCQHVWEKDPPQMNERTSYTCKTCNLDKNSYLYP